MAPKSVNSSAASATATTTIAVNQVSNDSLSPTGAKSIVSSSSSTDDAPVIPTLRIAYKKSVRMCESVSMLSQSGQETTYLKTSDEHKCLAIVTVIPTLRIASKKSVRMCESVSMLSQSGQETTHLKTSNEHKCLAIVTYDQLKHFLQSRRATLNTKMRIFNAYIGPIFLYRVSQQKGDKNGTGGGS